MWTPTALLGALVLAWHALSPLQESKTFVPATLRPSLHRAPAPSVRLSTDVLPVHYDLTVFSDLVGLAFQGKVNTTLDVHHDTQVIEFHAGRNLDLGAVHVTTPKGSYLLTPTRDLRRERVAVTLPQQVHSGDRIYVATGYRGDLDKSMRGYYYSTWHHNGESGHYALTQFEPTSARRAYPSWDEPSSKATFAVRLVHRTNTTALGNMPSSDTRPVSRRDVAELLSTDTLHMRTPKVASDVWSCTEFEQTPRMSTYLVAWANGYLEHVSMSTFSPLSGREIPLRMFATPEFVHLAQYALESMARVLPEYEKVFDIAYPLPKLDAVAAADFDFGAMENWGLITGRNSVFMYDDLAGLQGQKKTAGIMSHEIAHMWFGDIATIGWWQSLWLNEAFATFMGEVLILDRVHPEWNSASDFVVTHLMRALELDAKRSSHQIEIPLLSENVEDDITQAFDGISYSKGASVLRMLSHMIGENVFLQGVSLYLKKHLYDNTVTKDLWDGISEASGQNISAIMTPWVKEQGFPVLTVSEKNGELQVRQHRFLETGDPSADEDATLWHVPLGLKLVHHSKTEVDYDAVLPAVRNTTLRLSHDKDVYWKLNADMTGVYRVAYPAPYLAKLGALAAGKNSPFSQEDRVNLLDDAFALARAGYGRTSSALSLLQTLRHDTSALVHRTAALGIGRLMSTWWEQPDDVRAALQRFSQSVFAPLARKLTFTFGKSDTPAMRELRATVIAAAAAAGDAWTLAEIERRFAPLRDHGDASQIPPDLLRTVMLESVKHGGTKEYETAWDMFHHPETPAHKAAALSALGAPQDSALIERSLDLVFSGGVQAQDLGSVYVVLSSNQASRRRLWEATKEHFDDLMRVFDGNFSVVDVIKASFAALSSHEDLEDVKRFFKHKATSQYSMSLAQGLESVVAQARWLERDADDVHAWLQAHGFLS